MQAIWQTIPIAHIVKIELRKRRQNLWLQKNQDISVSHRIANNVTYEDVLQSIESVESEAQTVKDCQFVCKMRLKLQDIKYQAKFDDLYARLEGKKTEEAVDDL